MATESLKFARFDHPQHGSFDNPDEVLQKSDLSAEDKREILTAWKTGLTNDPTAGPDDHRHSLDAAIADLAKMKI